MYNLYSLSISGRLTLNMHSLNNEGTEGNQVQTRMATLVTPAGETYVTNAISGDMFKHILSEHFYRLAKESLGKLPLCAGCRVFDANRASADAEFIASISGVDDAVALDRLLQVCAMDDIAGNLITGRGRALPRKSVAEFGWVLGLPGTKTETFFHVKYSSHKKPRIEEGEEAGAIEESDGTNLSQAILHRPASSGVYAVVVNVDVASIGFNESTQRYAVEDDQRDLRCKALLESMLYTFIQPNGAMRSTQNPHIVDFSGAVVVSTQNVPSPALSPVNANYRQELVRLSDVLNNTSGLPNAVRVRSFDSMGDFGEIMMDLIANSTPYKLVY